MRSFVIFLFLIAFSSISFAENSYIVLSFKNNAFIKDHRKIFKPYIGQKISERSIILTKEKSSIKVLLNTSRNTYVFLITANKELKTSYLRTKKYITGNKTIVLSSTLGNIFNYKENNILNSEISDLLIYPKGKIFFKPDIILWNNIKKAVAYEFKVTDIKEGKKKTIITGPDINEIKYPKELREFGPNSDIFIKLQAKFKDIDDIVSKNLFSGPISINEWAKLSQVFKNIGSKNISEKEKALILTEFLYNNEYYVESLAWALLLKNTNSKYIDTIITNICRKLNFNDNKLNIFEKKAAQLLRRIK